MMADFVNQHMRDDFAEGIPAAGPEIKNGAAEQKDGVRRQNGVAEAFLREIHAVIESEKIVWALKIEFDQE